MNKYANFFDAEGYKNGDVVSLFMENGIDFFAIWLGLSKVSRDSPFGLIKSASFSWTRGYVYFWIWRSGPRDKCNFPETTVSENFHLSDRRRLGLYQFKSQIGAPGPFHPGSQLQVHPYLARPPAKWVTLFFVLWPLYDIFSIILGNYSTKCEVLALNSVFDAGLLPRGEQTVFLNAGESKEHRILEAELANVSDTEPRDRGIHFQSELDLFY